MKPLSSNMTELILEEKELLEEFVETLRDQAPMLEREVTALKNAPDDTSIVTNLFRTAHNIKGDASICKVQIAVDIVHPIESLLARLRKQEFRFTEVLAEAILLSIDRMELAIDDIRHNRSQESLRLVALLEGLNRMADAPVEEVDNEAAAMIEAVTDFRPIAYVASMLNEPIPNLCQTKPKMLEDLAFFRAFANLFELRSPLFKGRTLRLLHLANASNQIKNFAINPEQLEAAIYMHDAGMMFLPESIWLKQDHMNEEERYMLREHPKFAAGLLDRMESWKEAALMIEQHHEMANGEGYPQGLLSEKICDGAKLLSIVDAFESIMLKHASRGKSRSVLRAVAEINACDNQFAPEWIAPFNQVIRKMAEGGR